MNIIKKLLTILNLSLVSSIAFANKFPVTFDTKFGPVTIEKQPQRVATLDYAGADNLLALGIQPITVRYWYGNSPNALWPWASKLLEDDPTILKFPINIENLIQAKPDVILALWAGITIEEFERLSAIAPVVGPPKGTYFFALPWEQRAILAGRAVGKEELARQKVADIKKKFAQVRAKHPNWKNKTYVITYNNPFWKLLEAFSEKDFRAIAFSGFGLKLDPKIENFISTAEFHKVFDTEDYEMLDADVVIWLDSLNKIDTIEGRKRLKSYKEGREVIFDETLSAALSHSSLLSLPYLIDKATPLLEKVLDKKRGKK